MTEEQQRIAIAEFRGWTEISIRCMWGLPPGEFDCGTEDCLKHLPDYLNDLNAMHEAEKMLDANQRTTYRAHLACMFTDHPDDGMRFAITATAAQRSEAFLRTIGKWVES